MEKNLEGGDGRGVGGGIEFPGGGGRNPGLEGMPRGYEPWGVTPTVNRVPGGYRQRRGGDENSPSTQAAAMVSGEIEKDITPKYITQELAAQPHKQ